MKHIAICFILFILGAMSLFACKRQVLEFGVLEGLLPVVREGDMESTPEPAVYAAREVVIYSKDGKTEVARVKIDPSGDYRTELPVGAYVVDINHAGIDTAADLPKKIDITSQGVTSLDIDIDTGIR